MRIFNALLGHDVCIHDGEGETWDRNILNEVVNCDCYGLTQFRIENPEAKFFLDIGANIGSFALLVEHFWPGATVYCAEPMGDNFALLEQNVAMLDNMVCIERAIIGTDDESVGFRGPSLVTRMGPAFNSGDGKVERGLPTRVMACKLEALMGPAALIAPVDILKLDVEGAEAEILESLTPEQLKRIKSIRGEWHGEWMPKSLAAMLDATHDLEKLDYIFPDLGYFQYKLRAS